MFVCADNGEGYLDKKRTFHTITADSFSSSIDHMLIDYQGNLWFTSSRLGLLRLSKSVFSEVYSEDGLDDQVVNTVTKWNGRLLIGTDDGLQILDGDGTYLGADPLAAALEDVRIRCMRTDSKNRLWICTSGYGLICVDADGAQKTYDSSSGALGDKFRSVLELADGTIAAAGDSGVTFIRDGQVVTTVGADEGMRNPKTLCLLELADGRLLAGTDGGGIAVIKDGAYQGLLQREDGLGSEVILRMVAEKDGDGTFLVTSNSLCYMQEDGQIRLLDNFPYYNNYDLVEGNDGTLFVLGSAGIYIVDKQELLGGEELEYELLNSKKGLQKALTANAWDYVDEEDNLYLSTDSGVVYINLDRYDNTVRSYRMLLRTVRVDGVDYDVDRGEAVSIPKGVTKIDFVPEVINYSVENPYVSVWLEGFDKEPQVMLQSELGELSYMNLPTGDYTFHLAVLDAKGKSVLAESTYEIIREKDIYDNWWFVVYMILVFTLAVIYLTWLLFRTQIQKTLDMQKRELELARQQLEMGNETILTIARTVDARDENTSQHSRRVSEYSVLIAQRLGFSPKECDELRRCALLHDIGKIGIPDQVLNKPARLTDEEYEIMKSHVVKGAEILKSFTLLPHVEEGALYHHERYDGKGYVHRLKGEEIPINARIIGIADAFDAMTANRVYRKKLDLDYVLGELKRCRGSQFDPKLVDILLELIETGVVDVEQIYGMEG
jgi:energy-coupling factor transport system substrate-specific component